MSFLVWSPWVLKVLVNNKQDKTHQKNCYRKDSSLGTLAKLVLSNDSNIG